MSPAKTCAACRFWKPGPTQGLAGECRAKPPVLLMFSDRPETHFPEANAEDWCGEWRGRPRCANSYTSGDGVMEPCQRHIGHTGQCGPLDVISGATP